MRNYSFYTLYILLNLFFCGIWGCSENTLDNSETDFAVKDTSLITKIEIKNGKDSLLIEKNNNIWQINNKFISNTATVKRLLNTIYLLELKSPLPKNILQKVKSEIKNKTNVKIYSGENLLKSFYIGDYYQKSGNYIMLDGAEKPYIAYIPTFDFDLLLNFDTNQKNWQSKILFAYKPEQIKTINYTNNNLEESFLLQKNNNNFLISKNKETKAQKVINNDYINNYLEHYSNVKFEKFVENIDVDSLQKNICDFSLEITDTENNKIKISAYKIVKNGTENENYFLGIINKKDVILAKYYNFDLLLKNYTYFVKE